MRAVNLLPADARAVHRSAAAQGLRRPPVIAAGAATFLVVAGLMALIWTSNSSVADKQKQLDALKAKIAATPSPAAVIRSAEAAAGRTSPTVQSRRATVTGLADNRLAWDEFLATFSNVVPENVWLQSFQAATPGAAATLATAQAARAAAAAASVAASTTTTASAPAPTPSSSTTAGATSFKITGFTYSQPSVARLMRRMALVPWLTDVSLVTSSKSAIGSDTVYQFTLQASVIPTPEVSK
jgi:Tfp pilus assembly protein PilN